MTGSVVLDWRHARTGPPAPCVLCGEPALCRLPGTGEPCHKGCAEEQLTSQTRDTDKGQLVAGPGREQGPPKTAATPAALACALGAADRGWRVFPLRPGGKRPAFPDHDAGRCTGRDPRCRGGHQGWEPRATTDPGRISRAWTRAPYGVGIATGPSGLVVIDLDTPKPGQDIPAAEWRIAGVRTGADVLAVICERAGQPYPSGTYTVTTGRGGTHLYFTAPPGTELRNTQGAHGGLGWLIDTRARGGYVVGAGSTVNARPYTVARDVPPAPLPAWLADRLRPGPLPPQKPVDVPLLPGRGRLLPAGRDHRRNRAGDLVPGARAQHRALPRRHRARAARRRGSPQHRRRDRLARCRRRERGPATRRSPAHHCLRAAGRGQTPPERGRVNTTPPHLHVVRTGQEPAAPEPQSPARLRTAWTADELMAADFPEPRWAVPGILAEGVNLLAGPPKVGKSWLSLGIALAVAAGGKALDAISVQAGPVLYLALEDTPRRLQTRIRKILAGQAAPGALTLATACPPLPDGGEQAIGAWLGRHPDARLVVIDVFAKMRGRAPSGMSAYDADYAAIGHAKRLADRHGVAVVLVHHVRKAGSDDFLAEVSGTNGLAGAADATLVLKRARGQADGVLHVTGRDVDEAEYALRFVSDTGAWLLLDGPPGEHTLPDTRAAILRHLRQQPGTTPAGIAEATGLPRETVKKTCQRMTADGQLCADAAGRYRLPATTAAAESVPAVPAVPNQGLTCENGPGEWGHPRGHGVPGVPVSGLTSENVPGVRTEKEFPSS